MTAHATRRHPSPDSIRVASSASAIGECSDAPSVARQETAEDDDGRPARAAIGWLSNVAGVYAAACAASTVSMGTSPWSIMLPVELDADASSAT